MTDGTTEAGILSVIDSGGAAPLEVSWISDADRARPAAQVEAAAPHAAGRASQRTPEVSPSDNDPELLPEVITGVMEPLTDNVCPGWDSTTRAKEMIVYLTAAIKGYADADREMLANSRNAPPEAAAAIARQVNANQVHAQALLACRDSIARKLNMDSAAVQRLYDYNTLTADEMKMFSDLEDNYNGQPNFFSQLLAMPDQRLALHLIDLEIKERDFGIAQWLTSIDHDAGKPTEETDRELLVRDRSFRKALVAVRTRIAKKLATTSAASRGSGPQITMSDTPVAPSPMPPEKKDATQATQGRAAATPPPDVSSQGTMTPPVAKQPASAPEPSPEPPSLSVKANINGELISIKNADRFAWQDCVAKINPPVFSFSSFSLKLGDLKAGNSIMVAASDFTQSDGERFNPVTHEVQSLYITCTTPQGQQSWMRSRGSPE